MKFRAYLKKTLMFKRIIFTGFLLSSTLLTVGQAPIRKLSDKEKITDNSIIYPVDMEQNYDQLLSSWRKELKYSDNCVSFSDSPVTFYDSTYIRRLYSLPTKMELVFNPVVRSYIEMYAGRRRNQVSYMLGEGMHYFPLFEEALDKEGLPLELKYLPVIESALNPVARSRVGATGLWQFMAGTGKMYDLEINSLVDERRDPVKSSSAAAKYLKDLYSIYKDWNLVIAAYNCGPGNVNKAIRRSGGQTDYWAIYPYLPKETRGYVPAFIAATYIMNYHNEHNICPTLSNKPASLDSLMIRKNLHLQQIADVINVPIDELRQYNPQFTDDIIPGDFKPYSLKLPIKNISAFIDNENTIYSHKTEELLTHRKVAGLDVASNASPQNSKLQTITHRVKKRETLANIARKYGVTSSQLKKWNKLSSNKVSAGKILKINRYIPNPKKQEESSDKELVTNTNKVQQNNLQSNDSKLQAKTITSYYKVRRGDTWAGIAKKNNATITDIKKWNNIKSNSVNPGTRLKIQRIEFVPVPENIEAKSDSSEQPIIEDDDMDDDSLTEEANTSEEINITQKDTDKSSLIYHRVRIGETITQIATRYNVTQENIVSWNKLSSNVAKVGQRLLIHLPDGKSETVLSDSTKEITKSAPLSSADE